MSEKNKKNSAELRLKALFDDGVYWEIDGSAKGCGAHAAYGSVGGATVFALCQDSQECGGAVSAAHSRKFAKVYDLASKTGAPVVTIYDSEGVKVDNGFASLEAASEILKKCSELSGVVPQIAVVVGVCAGFAAMTAALADVTVMSKDGELFLTSPFTDKASGGSEKGVGSAEYAEKADVAAILCENEDQAIAKAVEVVKLLPLNNLAALPAYDFDVPTFKNGSAVEAVADVDSVVELFSGIGGETKTSLVTLGGMPCGAIEATGKIDKDAAAKCAKLVEVCDSFNLPIVSFINSDGFKASAENDKTGGIKSAAKLAHVLAEATTAKVSVITGDAIGSVFSTFCSKNGGSDMSYAWDGAVISALPVNAAATLVYEIKKDSDIASLGKKYASEYASAEKAAENGIIDGVIEPASTRDVLVSAIDMLSSKRVSRLPKKHGNLPL